MSVEERGPEWWRVKAEGAPGAVPVVVTAIDRATLRSSSRKAVLDVIP